MNSLSHEQAREWIQQGDLMDEDRLALRQHLATCDECRAYAAVHVQLAQQLALRPTRTRPTAAQRAAILDAAGVNRSAPRLWRPLATLGSVAAVLFLATAFWLVLRAASPVASRPERPAPWATLLAPWLAQPTLTPQPTDPAPTATVAAPAPLGTPDPRGRYVIDTVPAPSLAGNAIGEPPAQQVAVYLPPSYDSSERRYPVVYAMLVSPTNIEANQLEMQGAAVRSAMNLALRRGKSPEMIVVILDTVNALGVNTYFVNSPVTGDWETYLAQDLVAHIDGHYRTLPSPDSRALIGEVCNGLPALMAAVRYPDVFSAAYLLNPLVFAPGDLERSGFVSDIARTGVSDVVTGLMPLPGQTAVAPHGGMASLLNGQLPSVALETVAYGLAFAPTADAQPPYFRYLFDGDERAGEATWQQWANGLGNVPQKLQSNLDALQALHIAISNNESWTGGVILTVDKNATYLSEQMAALNIPHRFIQLDKSSIEEMALDAMPFFAEVLVSE